MSDKSSDVYPNFIKLIFKDGVYKFDANLIIKHSPKIRDNIKSSEFINILDYDLSQYHTRTFDILWSCKYYSVKKFEISPSQLIEVFSLIEYLEFNTDDIYGNLSFLIFDSLRDVTYYYDILKNNKFTNSFKKLFRGFFDNYNLVLVEDTEYLSFKVKDEINSNFNEPSPAARKKLCLYKKECQIIERFDQKSAKFFALFAKFYDIYKITITNYNLKSDFINNASFIDFTSLKCNLQGECSFPDNMEKLDFLTELSIYINNSKDELNLKIENLSNLKSLKINSEMNYIAISTLPKLKDLESLYLSYIEIDSAQVSAISTYKNLKKLHLEFFANNDVVEAINNLSNLTNLTLIPTFDCEWNLKSDFYYIPFYTCIFVMPDKLYNLEYLYIEEIQDLEYDFASKLIKYDKLKELTIINTEISDVDMSNIFKINNLEKLRLFKQNFICDWKKLEILKNLKEFEISGLNFDSEILKHLQGLSKLSFIFSNTRTCDKDYVSDIFTHLSGVKNLRSLSLNFSGNFNLKCNKTLEFIEEIEICDVELSKKDVEFIYNFPRLRKMKLINCNINQDEILNSKSLELTIYDNKNEYQINKRRV